MRILIYGLGRSGTAAARLVHSQGHELEFADARPEGADVDELLDLGATRIASAAESRADLVIAAPGVRMDHPDLAAMAARGVEVIGEVEWVQRSFPDSPIVGVTGTAGKGTVTTWIAHVLKGAGVDVEAGGNLDPALAAVARPGAVLVTELSSFQLERVPNLAPRVAVALNLGSDHLDRYASLAEYHAAKRNLINNLGPDSLLVYNGDDPGLVGWARSTPAPSRAFSLAGPADAWLHGENLVLDGRPLIAARDLGVPGRHNAANALAVALTADELGVDRDAIRRGLASYGGLPGRYSTVASFGGITFVEDSIATRPLAVAAALAASRPPVVWLAGGHDKGADLKEFRTVASERVGLFIGFGRSGGQFCRELADVVPTLHLDEPDGRKALRAAVRAAVAHLRAHSPRGGTVLLAPLAASFDQFRDYRERADVFRQEVGALEEEWILSS